MNINEQELSEAVETLYEGSSTFGISNEDVYRKMLSDDSLAMELMDNIHAWNSFVDFESKFKEAARDLLTEAARTHKEQQAGLM